MVISLVNLQRMYSYLDAMNPQPRIHNSCGITCGTHFRASRVVVDRVRVLPRKALQVFVRPEDKVLAAWHLSSFPHSPAVLLERACLRHRQAELHSLHNHLIDLIIAKVLHINLCTFMSWGWLK